MHDVHLAIGVQACRCLLYNNLLSRWVSPDASIQGQHLPVKVQKGQDNPCTGTATLLHGLHAVQSKKGSSVTEGLQT